MIRWRGRLHLTARSTKHASEDHQQLCRPLCVVCPYHHIYFSQQNERWLHVLDIRHSDYLYIDARPAQSEVGQQAVRKYLCPMRDIHAPLSAVGLFAPRRENKSDLYLPAPAKSARKKRHNEILVHSSIHTARVIHIRVHIQSATLRVHSKHALFGCC